MEKGRKGEREESGGNGWSAGPCGGRGEGSENGGVVYLARSTELGQVLHHIESV